MAKFKPYKGSAKFDVCMGTLDVIGMTDIPGVSQLAEAGSAVGNLAKGDLLGFGLSVGSMIPVVGKVCEGAKVAQRAQRVTDATVNVVKNTDKAADAAATVGKNVKFGNLSVTAKLKSLEEGADIGANAGKNVKFGDLTVSDKLKRLEEGAEEVVEEGAKKMTTTKSPSAPKTKPSPAATQAKSPKIDGPKEVQLGKKLDTSDGETFSIDKGNWYNHLNGINGQKSNDRGITHQNYYWTQSIPVANNIIGNMGKHSLF